MATIMKNFPLLNEIDEQKNFDDIDWNKNAFQTLLTSNLPTTTVFYYAIDVGLRRLENSLYETYWDITADALNDLSQFLFNTPSNDLYLYEARCQLLMYASIAIIKLNTIRRRSINEAKMFCATMFLLLLEQSKSYETTEDISCTRSMRLRYLKRIFIIGQWLPTLTKTQFDDIESNHEQYIATMMEQLFPAVSLRDKINEFIDNILLNNNNNSDDETTTNGFVFIQRFPKFNENNCDLTHIGVISTLNQYKNPLRKLTSSIWTLSCMIQSNRISLGGEPRDSQVYFVLVLNHCITREYFSQLPIDFEQKPILIESLNEQDVIVFLLLCAQQNINLSEKESILHPYLLYSSSHLCTPGQKKWWLTAIDQKPWPEFIDHLATIRLDEERINHYPPKIIILQTAKILFKTAQTAYEQHSNRSASAYEQYAIQYLETAKAIIKNQNSNDSLKSQGNKHEKLFFFYSQKSIHENNEENKKLINQCEKLARQCDELKLLPEPEPPKPLTPIKDFHISSILSPVQTEEPKPSLNVDSSLFATPLSNKTRDVDVQTIEQTPPPSPILPIPPVEEIIEIPAPSFPPLVDMLFSHMNSVNQWINGFSMSNEGIQNDINTIRDRLEKLNRATSQMIFSNVKIFQSNPSENNGQFYPPN